MWMLPAWKKTYILLRSEFGHRQWIKNVFVGRLNDRMHFISNYIWITLKSSVFGRDFDHLTSIDCAGYIPVESNWWQSSGNAASGLCPPPTASTDLGQSVLARPGQVGPVKKEGQEIKHTSVTINSVIISVMLSRNSVIASALLMWIISCKNASKVFWLPAATHYHWLHCPRNFSQYYFHQATTKRIIREF